MTYEVGFADVVRVACGFTIPILGRPVISVMAVWELFVETENRLIHIFEYVFGFAFHVWLVQAGFLAF